MDIEAKKKEIVLKPRYFFNVINADNEILVFTNSRRIYHNRTNNDDEINDRIRLGVRKGYNNVVIIGINWRGTSHFHFQIIKQHRNPYDDEILEEVDVRLGGMGAIYQGFFHYYLKLDPPP